MMPMNIYIHIYIYRKCTGGSKSTKSQAKINNLIYMDDMKILAKNEKYLQIVIQIIRIYSQVIGIAFRMEKYVMLINKKTNYNKE